MDKEKVKSEIKKLIDKYDKVKDKHYNEEATKNDFILPLFKILGWDVEDSDEVSKEENISGKRVDYGFRIDGIPKFFLEAKGLNNEDLEGSRMVKGREVTYAEQATNYAYYKGCNWAVLTNFKGIKVYDAWAKSSPSSSFRFAIWIDTLLNDFDNSLYLLSKEAFEQGLLDKKYSLKSRKRPITEQLLLDFTKFRGLLSKDVYKLNESKKLSEDDLDEAIQRLFDRLIFIRNCEDRELEPYDLLSALRQWEDNKKGAFVNKLKDIFLHYDNTYNSKIFSKHLCDEVEISDNILSKIVSGLYTTEDGSINYDFSLIDADVLGNIYEQYLGHVLNKTKLTESKLKRKEEGIYYTPSHIVEYIVRNTVGELIQDKKADVSKIKILDPACGSGSFLIKAFDILNEYYSKKEGYKQNKLDLSDMGTNYSTKLGILKNNIFGVDLDKQAVDIAQLNLLLKVAEKKRRLPVLQENIKSGNSLIEDPNLIGDKAFNWVEQFNWKFDVVIGNPPYFNVKSDDVLKNSPDYKLLSSGVVNSASLFIKKGLDLLKTDGYLGFIIPKSLLTVDSWEMIRSLILKNSLISVCDVGMAFDEVGLEQTIIIVRKTSSENNKTSILKNFKEINSIKQSFFKERNAILSSVNKTQFNIIKKIESGSILLGDMAEMPRGITVKSSDYFPKPSNKFIQVIGGTNVERYAIKPGNKRKPDKYLDKNDARIIQKNDIFNNERIVYQNIVSSVPKIVATLETNNLPTDDTLNNLIISNQEFSNKYVLAILNSSLATFYLKYAIINCSILTVHLDKPYIGKLPIKNVNNKDKAKLDALVDKLVELKKKSYNLGSNLTDKKINLDNEINKTSKDIDELIYNIYEITDEEKKTIEQS